MKKICEACEGGNATVYCKDCKTLNFYCQRCFYFTHTDGTKKSHNFASSVPFPCLSGTPGNMCPEHPDKYKEYVCSMCGITICSECATNGLHKGHRFSSIETGFNKNVEEFGPIVESCIKHANEPKEEILTAIERGVGKLKTMLAETDMNFSILQDKITEKSSELLAKIYREIDISKKYKLELEAFNMKLYSDCEDYIKSITLNGNACNCESYELVQKKIAELKVTKEKYEKDFLEREEISCNYLAPDLATVLHSLNELTITHELMSDVHSSFVDGSLLIKDPEHLRLIYKWILEANPAAKGLKLIYRGSTDGMTAEAFHFKCDAYKPTLSVISASNGQIFGGYTAQSWRHTGGGYCNDPAAFIFSLTHKSMHAKQKHANFAIFADAKCGPIFGAGADICVALGHGQSYSNGGKTFSLPPSIDGTTYFAGTKEFVVKEIEVFSVNFANQNSSTTGMIDHND